MNKIKLLLVVLLYCCSTVFAQVSEQQIVVGDSVSIVIEEMVQLEDGTSLDQADTYYSLFIKKVGIVTADTIFYRSHSDDVPMDIDSIQTIILNGNFINEVGDYEIYGCATRYVSLNFPVDAQWIDGNMSEILLVRAVAANDLRKPGRLILKFKE